MKPYLYQTLTQTNTANLPDDAIHPEQLQQFYAHHRFRPVWNAQRLHALQQAIAALAQQGLNPKRYQRIQHLKAAYCTDIQITQIYLQALFDLRFGQLRTHAVSQPWTAPKAQISRSPDDYAGLIAAASADIDDIEGVFRRAQPNNLLYTKLLSALRKLQKNQRQHFWQPLPAHLTLKPGQRHRAVLTLRERLFAEHYLLRPEATTAAYLFDSTVERALMRFQHDHDLKVDGILGRDTRNTLNISYRESISQLIANLERIRWLSSDTNNTMVRVNIANASITLFDHGHPVWQARTQIGRPARPTPALRSQITHFTVNPTWTVPPTILRKDKLPRIRQEPDFLQRNRLRVFDQYGTQLAYEDVDWQHPHNITLRQDAGAGNALGRIAIRFPNPFSIYLHDTPSKHLFQRAHRAFSSGCVRVENAVDFAQILAAREGEAQFKQLEKLLSRRRTRQFHLKKPVTITVVYQTAYLDKQHKLHVQPDIYRKDRAIAQTLQALPPDAEQHDLPHCDHNSATQNFAEAPPDAV